MTTRRLATDLTLLTAAVFTLAGLAAEARQADGGKAATREYYKVTRGGQSKWTEAATKAEADRIAEAIKKRYKTDDVTVTGPFTREVPAASTGPFTAGDPASYRGQVVGTGHCVPFVQRAAGAPHTSKWVRGDRVRDGNVPVGTAVATLTEDGYPNKSSGNHAAVFDGYEGDVGFWVWDQWKGQPVHRRLIRYKGGQGSPSNDGDAFYVIRTE